MVSLAGTAANIPDEVVLSVPHFRIKSDGSELPAEQAARIAEISVRQEASGVSGFNLSATDPELELIEPGGPLAEGARVSIELGYLGRLVPMLEGRVTAVGASFPESGAPLVNVEGMDLLSLLMHGTAYREFDAEQTDADIVAVIAGDAGLAVEAEAGESRRRPRIQKDESGLRFLMRLAAENGCAVWMEGNRLRFARERPSGEEIELEWGRTLLSFTPRLSVGSLAKRVRAVGWDPEQAQPFEATADVVDRIPIPLDGRLLTDLKAETSEPRERVLPDTRASSERLAEAWAVSEAEGMAHAALSASGSAPGDPRIRVGTVLNIVNVGRFGTRWVVAGATHSISATGGYRTNFDLNSGETLAGGDETALDAAAGRPATRVGVVVSTDDPDGQGRVQVRLAARGASGEPPLVWARLASPAAGGGRGLLFPPEPEDEVLIVYEENDPERPIVLGALWNGRAAPPDPNEGGENNLRVITTRSGHSLRFDDTEGAERIELVDASGENTLTIDTKEKTITLRAGKDIKLEAPEGTISLGAKALVLTSKEAIRLAADGELTLEGGPKAVLKGTVVEIN